MTVSGNHGAATTEATTPPEFRPHGDPALRARMREASNQTALQKLKDAGAGVGCRVCGDQVRNWVRVAGTPAITGREVDGLRVLDVRDYVLLCRWHAEDLEEGRINLRRYLTAGEFNACVELLGEEAASLRLEGLDAEQPALFAESKLGGS